MSVHSKYGRTWLTKLERIGELSIRDKNTVFNNIGHLICIDILKEQYHQLNGNKAIGSDNVTKLIYGENLDDNLNNLICRAPIYQGRQLNAVKKVSYQRASNWHPGIMVWVPAFAGMTSTFAGVTSLLS